ncbi:amino acid ABC transporter membrane protein 1, PAAT family (TC 3.A.1.3.-) [Enhydrobacter aerosaccus]|uniref:Amino acid ABC transporter membrane protein 1, PAAT family (TC 3.A.1.3.-) n=1 Tax=Enhydrobacter aerosaccus TaxID=225324 RepID=A0A1T4P3L5_9HYPH|nr:amino acid ABC transporter permease [Enhydrobacter aerosaccus]SJZ86113.1 amino acid ABC transporter membrane protein 1, PAAT family (TC 3.A.1.3.-) [Enhydrobacter aerosaccus]
MSYDFDFSFLAEKWPAFVAGAWLTVQLTVVSIALGFAVGTICALCRVYGGAVLRRLVGGYVELIRNTPLLVQIFIVYFGLSSLGLKLSAEVSAVIALVVNMGAYTTEIMRAGLQSIQRTQLEAADCLGLTRLQAIIHVVLLPAMERVYPALSSQAVLLMLASSITSQISAEELTATANLVQSDTYRSFEVYIVVAVVYLALSALYRLAFWLLALVLFERKRRLGTAL